MSAQFQDLKEKYDALATRVAALERAFVPTEGELTWEKVIQGILRNDHGPIEEWKRRGYPIPGMKD